MLSLDHVGFACRQVGDILPIFEACGFAPTEPRELCAIDPGSGRPTPLGQTSAHIVMADTYIELSAVPDSRSGNHLEPFLARYEGLHILALRDQAPIEASQRRMRGAGLAVTPVRDATREIHYGDRHGDARFRWFMLDAATTPEGLVCVVDNLTPELVYQDAVTAQPNGASGISGVIVCATETVAVARRLADICAARVTAQNVLILPNTVITVTSPDELAARYRGLNPPAVPSMVGLELRVQSIDAVESRIATSGLACFRQGKNRLAVALPAPANGILLFREQEKSHAD